MIKIRNRFKKLRYGFIATAFISIQIGAALVPFMPAQRTFAADTGFSSPTSSPNPEEWSFEDFAFSSNDVRAWANLDNQDQGYAGFNIAVPSGSVIDGIEVAIEAQQQGTTCQLQVRLSQDGGSNHTARKTLVPTGSDSILTYGGSGDLWGAAWTPASFSNANFHLEIRYNDPGSGCDSDGIVRDEIFVDHIQVKVYYTEPVVIEPGSITITKLIDGDGNLLTDDDQTGASGWTFDIDGAPTNPDPVVSGAQGVTETVEVEPGTYSITETLQDGYGLLDATCEKDGETLDGVTLYNLVIGEDEHLDCTFINAVNVGSIKVYKQVDSGDGYEFVGTESPFKWGLDTEPTATRDIDSTADNLSPGTHTVYESGPANYTFEGWYVGDGACTGDINETEVAEVEVLAGKTTEVTFCNKEIKNSKISGYKFHDVNGNGSKQIWEPRLGGWTIELYKDGGVTPFATTTTSYNLFSYGQYSFNGLGAGEYKVCEVAPPGWQQITPDPGVNAGCFTFTLDGTNNKTAIFGNQARATITVIKNVDRNGDGDTNDWNESNRTDWTWNYYSLLDSDTNVSTGSTETVRTGTLGTWYLLHENQKDGYDLTDLGCNVPYHRIGDAVSLFVKVGDEVVCTFTNTKKPQLTIIKDAKPQDGTNFCFDLKPWKPIDISDISLLDSYSGDILSLLDEEEEGCDFWLDDTVDFDGVFNVHKETLKPGTYIVTEKDLPDGWRLDDVICWGADEHRYGNSIILELNYGDKVVCKFKNKKDGQVKVTKFHDYNRDGEWDEGEPALEGWDMTLQSEECEIPEISILSVDSLPMIGDCDYEYDKTQTTVEDGTTTFEYVKPYTTHYLTETVQEGWHWSNTYCDYGDYKHDGELVSDNLYALSLSPDATIECFVGNYADPELSLTKTNDNPDAEVGDTVTYTLEVKVPENVGPSYNTTIVDLPPEGFNFVAGSNTGDGELTKEYSSPGVWNLGTILPGNTLTVSYQVKIASSVSPGTYNGLAFAQGCATPACTTVALSNLPQSDTPFANSAVTIADDASVLADTGSPLGVQYSLSAVLMIIVSLITTRRRATLKGGRK